MTMSDVVVDPAERGVMPVIGIILLVAIAVVLSAGIGSSVLDLGQNLEETGPSVSLTISDADEDYDAGTGTAQSAFLIEHQAGDAYDLETMRITVRRVDTNGMVLQWEGARGVDSSDSISANWLLEYNGAAITAGATQTMEAGDVIVIKADATTDLPDDTTYKLLVGDRESRTTIAQDRITLR